MSYRIKTCIFFISSGKNVISEPNAFIKCLEAEMKPKFSVFNRIAAIRYNQIVNIITELRGHLLHLNPKSLVSKSHITVYCGANNIPVVDSLNYDACKKSLSWFIWKY